MLTGLQLSNDCTMIVTVELCWAVNVREELMSESIGVDSFLDTLGNSIKLSFHC